MAQQSLVAKKQWGRILAIVIVGVLYVLTRPPGIAEAEIDRLAQHFAFTPHPLPEVAGPPMRQVRRVQPSLEHISAWISAVGASVALHDIDGDGLANDVCYVEVRTNQVIVAPVPTTGARFAPFTLEPQGLFYDASTMAPTGCLPGDFNEDGFSDILVYFWGRAPVIYLNRGEDGGALNADAYVGRDIVAGDARWFTNALTVADVDGDGHADLIVGNYFPDGAGILDPNSDSRGAMQHSMTRAYNAGDNRIFLWAGRGRDADGPRVRYGEAAGALPRDIAKGWTLALGAADLDGDLLPELYFANDFGPDRLLHNRSTPGRPAFALLEGDASVMLPASLVLGRDSFKGMGVDFGDVNGDGLLDIYVSNIATTRGLQESHFLWLSTGAPETMKQGRAPYVHGSEKLGLARSGWGWESRFGDFDNNGVLEAVQATGFIKGNDNRWPELQSLATSNDELLTNPRFWPSFKPGVDLSGHEANAFFVRAANGRYQDIAAVVGLGAPVVTRGIATADVDGDGDLDLAFANQWEPSVYFENDCPNCAEFLGLHLRLPTKAGGPEGVVVTPGHPHGPGLSRPAIGATATVHLPDGRRLVGQVDGGNGHSGSRAPDLHFGLDHVDADHPITVDLRWRDAMGRVSAQTVHLTPGWHTVLLQPQIREAQRP